MDSSSASDSSRSSQGDTSSDEAETSSDDGDDESDEVSSKTSSSDSEYHPDVENHKMEEESESDDKGLCCRGCRCWIGQRRGQMQRWTECDRLKNRF